MKKVIPDTSAALAEFKAGKLDMTELTHFVDQRIEMQEDSMFDVYATEPYYMHVLTFNVLGQQWDHLNSKFVEVEGFGNCSIR